MAAPKDKMIAVRQNFHFKVGDICQNTLCEIGIGHWHKPVIYRMYDPDRASNISPQRQHFFQFSFQRFDFGVACPKTFRDQPF